MHRSKLRTQERKQRMENHEHGVQVCMFLINTLHTWWKSRCMIVYRTQSSGVPWGVGWRRSLLLPGLQRLHSILGSGASGPSSTLTLVSHYLVMPKATSTGYLVCPFPNPPTWYIQAFGGPDFKPDRMTWIKPSFAWMLYRAGYGSKHGQENILKVSNILPSTAIIHLAFLLLLLPY